MDGSVFYCFEKSNCSSQDINATGVDTRGGSIAKESIASDASSANGQSQAARDTHTMIGMKIEGRMLFSNTLVSGSNTAYDTKKIVSVALYCPTERPSASSSPAILALPMLVRSRKASR